MSASMTQNELYKFLGDFPEIPEFPGLPGTAQPAETHDETAMLASMIRTVGIHRVAQAIGAFTNPIIRIYLKLLDAGVPPAAVRSFARVVVAAREGSPRSTVSSRSMDEVHSIFESNTEKEA